MKHSLPILTRWLPWGAGLLAAVVVGLLLEALTWMEADRREQAERAAVQAEVATARSRLESEMNATLSLSLGLSSFVLAKPDFTEADLIQVAGALVRMQPSIRSVAIAPDNQIRYIYPRAGNEKALGLRYLETPSQRDAVLRLMREQRPVTAGPVELAQGGVGIINRIPILFTRPDGSMHYWGLASVVIDPYPVFRLAGIREDAPGATRYALRGRDGQGAEGEVFLGEPALFTHPDAVLMEVVIPGGSWQLAAVQQAPARAHTVWNQIVMALLALFAGGVVAYAVSAHQRIRNLALHDNLTGLANRHQFALRARDMFAQAQRSGCRLTLLNIDIDGFKSINDTYGHAAGDVVLIHVASRLRACCRETDLLARLGGDEFVVLLPDTPAGDALNALLERLQGVIEVSVPGAQAPIPLRISVGMASCSEATPTLDALMHEADAAMYRAKAAGGQPPPLPDRRAPRP